MVFSEKDLVEDYIAAKLQETGWKFVPSGELQRDSYEEPLLIPNLVRALERINGAIGIGNEEIKRVLNELTFTTAGMEGAKRILDFYKFGVPVKFEKEKVVKYVRVFDFENIESNEFIVTRQVHYAGRENIRTDVMLYVNGIPLVDIECKNPTRISESWHSAFTQVKRYEREVPQLYKYVQIGVAAESEARYFPVVQWQTEAHVHEWREEGKDSIDAAVQMLSGATLLDIVGNFLFFSEKGGNATKVIARYMQYRAANRMVNRVLGNLVGEEDRNKGLVWHWQGSGKTLTMIFAANRLYNMPELENPTIFFIVDRIDLKDQLSRDFNSMHVVSPDIIGSTEELRQVLSHDDYRGRRGVLITLIHKFRPEELRELSQGIRELSKRKETVMNRRNVIAFIDEGHRTQHGLLAAQMKDLLRNAFFFALTGTPISKRGRDTYLQFSYPPQELYLDRYFITDSVRDGFTVKIVYQPRLAEEVHLQKDLLEGFLEAEFDELPEDIREDIEEKVKKRLTAIKLILENPERIKIVAQDIADHFKDNIDGKFKAMVVAASRKACVLYKKELDRHLPSEYSEVVMSYEADDKRLIQEYHEELRARYGGRDADEIKRRVIEDFREKEEGPLKILVVTDMLLTGFDAPILQVMYLDKPLKEHRLLQAVARTNRPFRDLKEAGLVVDYVGVLVEFRRALEAYYSLEDVRGAIVGSESVEKEFVELMEETLAMFGELARHDDRETLLKAIEVLTSEERRERGFVEKYKKLRKIFELLGPSEIKLEYLERYKWLSAIYAYYVKVVLQVSDYEDHVRKYYRKTIEFAHGAMEIEKLENSLPAIAFDEQRLRMLEVKGMTRREKAANILFALNKFVLVDRHRNPIYESLAERVRRLLELWKEKAKDYERIYKEGKSIIDDYNSLFNRRIAMGFTDLEYSMLLVLESRLENGGELAGKVRRLSKRLKERMFPGWLSQATVRKAMEREVRRFVRRLRAEHGLSLGEMDQLHKKLVDSVENYGGA